MWLDAGRDLCDIFPEIQISLENVWEIRYHWCKHPGNNRLVDQIDLFKIHHFDNMANATSLKMLEFNMRSTHIQDLPFTPGMILTHRQIQDLIIYNVKDVTETEKFYLESSKEIEFRRTLGVKYKHNLLKVSIS